MSALHARQQVLAKVAELIGATVVASEPHGTLKVQALHDTARAADPVALVSWRTDDVSYERVMGKPLLQTHRLTVAVTLRAKALSSDEGDTLADPCDALAVPVEALLQQERLNELVSAWRLTGTERGQDATGENTVLENTLLYQAEYRTRANEPTVIIK